MHISQKLKELREAKKMTLKKVSKQGILTLRFLTRLENGVDISHYHEHTIKSLGRLYGASEELIQKLVEASQSQNGYVEE